MHDVWVIAAVGAGLVVVGLLSLRRRSMASRCSRHSRVAGRVAVPMAWLSMVAGIALLVAALVVYLQIEQGGW
jgi:hypothetical protein